MTLTVAFSNFEFFFLFHFQKGFMLVYSREKLKCCFSSFFLQFQEFYLRIES